MASIDFRGADGVLSAYKARGLSTWAVFNKNNFMHSGEDETSLSDFLELMAQQGSRTTYTLKVYKSEAAEDVTDKSPCNGSFSFSLDDPAHGYMGGMSYGGGGGAMAARIAALEKKLSDEGKEKDPTIESTILGWFQDPDDVVKIIGAVKMLTGKASPAEMMQAVASIGNVKRSGETLAEPENEGETLSPSQQEQQLRVIAALARLEACDPDILLHLEQLATLAETNPAMYKMAIGFLK